MKKRAEPDFSVARGLFTVPRLSHGLKRGQHFPRNPVFSREQARLAPRAHVRELLCGTQSSKERLRRSRTESSAAAPAIEELAGEARQVRPARAACGFVSTDLGFLTGGEVRRAPGPPAPSTNLSPQRSNMPPLSCSRTTKAGSFPPGHDICREQTFYNNHAFLQVQTLPMPFASAMLSRGPKRGQHFPRNPAFSRAQARSAPRAHVRELLCGTQSSKEQLRRSRTESSAAPPAIEELAGEARQVRPARAACGSVSTDF